MLVLAQDPTVKVGGKVVTAEVDVPDEILSPGPRGYRVYVVDFDSSSGLLYQPAKVPVDETRSLARLLDDPAFHAQNVYAIVMRTLSRFEFALGRRISWSFDGHQIHVAPHAFRDANAFYSKRDRGLFFGYFEDAKDRRVFTCLSHDVVAHETTHALVDGLRERYTFPSSPDQAAFHEGFADVVALLSIFSLPGVVEKLMTRKMKRSNDKFVRRSELTRDALQATALFGLGEEVDPRHDALRRSVSIKPSKRLIHTAEFLEPHRRGELLVAAMMNAFLSLWLKRIGHLARNEGATLFRAKVADEGRLAADHLLTMGIRALDYAPATDLLFGDYLSALLTADLEVQPDDSTYHYRETLRGSFAAYGIMPTSSRETTTEPGVWEPPPALKLDYSRTHFDAMRQDRDEVFHFLWQNREALGVDDRAYTRVQSVRPCLRMSSDGFLLHETVAEYIQILNLKAAELSKFGLTQPKDMPGTLPITIYGGGVLIFDEYGQLKYHIRNRILNHTRQDRRLDYLWKSGSLTPGDTERRFAMMHRLRNTDGLRASAETECADAESF